MGWNFILFLPFIRFISMRYILHSDSWKFIPGHFGPWVLHFLPSCSTIPTFWFGPIHSIGILRWHFLLRFHSVEGHSFRHSFGAYSLPDFDLIPTFDFYCSFRWVFILVGRNFIPICIPDLCSFIRPNFILIPVLGNSFPFDSDYICCWLFIPDRPYYYIHSRFRWFLFHSVHIVHDLGDSLLHFIGISFLHWCSLGTFCSVF
jgi:hypothetical protein